MARPISPDRRSESSSSDSPLDRPASPDIPLTMSASVILTSQPRDVTAALAEVGGFPQEKVVVNFKPISNAPPLPRSTFKINSSHKFDHLVGLLRKKLKVKQTDSVFLYINQAFAPSLEEVIGNLHNCFKVNDQLVVYYCMTPAFG